MGLVEISPPTVLSPKVARFPRAPAKSNVEAKANGHLPGSTEPPLPLTPQRLELIRACAGIPPRGTDSLTASRIAQRFAPRAPGMRASGDARLVSHTAAAPLTALASGIRTLTAVLVVAALLPNLTLAAFWLGLIDLPWSNHVAAPASVTPIPAAQPVVPSPVLSAPDALEASAGDEVSFPIALDGTDGVPAGSIIAIRGLPQGSKLSSGYRRGETQWNLTPDEIGDLHLAVPDGVIGEAALTIQLVAPGDRIIADASTILKVMAAPLSNDVASPVETELRAAYISDAFAQELEVGEEETSALEAAPAEPEAVPLPTRRPTPPGDRDANWVKPSAFVNLREGPSSTAPVVGVVAKGTKLRVMGRKRGWVQVSNPATSHSGWIYSGNIDTAR